MQTPKIELGLLAAFLRTRRLKTKLREDSRIERTFLRLISSTLTTRTRFWQRGAAVISSRWSSARVTKKKCCGRSTTPALKPSGENPTLLWSYLQTVLAGKTHAIFWMSPGLWLRKRSTLLRNFRGKTKNCALNVKRGRNWPRSDMCFF